MEPAEQQHSTRYLLTLSFGALGVVYGDIGTSPLYAFRECFAPGHGLRPTPDNILGVLSLIFWALVVVISLKYMLFVLQADNRGEGGTFALISMVRPRRSKRRGALLAAGLFGAALLYGDSMITPAISVLSAVEGLEVATTVFHPYIVPLTIVIIIGLFMVQKVGTARVGAMFAPVMTVWFTTMSVLGVWHIVKEPHVLTALNPLHAFRFFHHNGVAGFLVLGSVFLVVTGGESLYADMGHFGSRPIRLTWFTFVLPSLLLNYFGQGAYLLHSPQGVEQPFFRMAPQWAVYPLVVLATASTAIASQAVISGAYSITRQAAQLGYLPRIRIRHTSAREIGQIYISSINWALMAAAITLVLAFRESGNLVAAYGIAVSGTMTVTSLLFTAYARERWRWSMLKAGAVMAPFIVIDVAFLVANLVKVGDGGWVPLAVGLAIFVLMSTWRTGRRILSDRLRDQAMSAEDFLRELAQNRIPRVPGTAIFMTRNQEGVPTTLLHNIKHNKVVHQRVVLLTVETEDRSHLAEDERLTWKNLGCGVYRLQMHFGFMEDPNIPVALSRLESEPGPFNTMTTSYFLGRETLIPTRQPGMAIWREHLFAWMLRNSSSASTFFSLPANQVIELGAQVEM